MKEGLPDGRSWRQGYSSGAWTGARSLPRPRLPLRSSVFTPARSPLGVLSFSLHARCVLLLPRSCLQASVHTIPAPSPSSSSSLVPMAHWPAWALLLKTLREEFGATCSSFLGMLCLPLAPGSAFLNAAPFGFRQLWSGSSTSDSGDPTPQGPWAQQQHGKVNHVSCGSALWLKRRSPYVPAETCARMFTAVLFAVVKPWKQSYRPFKETE